MLPGCTSDWTGAHWYTSGVYTSTVGPCRSFVGSSFSFLSNPNTLSNPYQYWYPAWFFPPWDVACFQSAPLLFWSSLYQKRLEKHLQLQNSGCIWTQHGINSHTVSCMCSIIWWQLHPFGPVGAGWTQKPSLWPICEVRGQLSPPAPPLTAEPTLPGPRRSKLTDAS